jgi:Fic/DOC family
MPPGLHTKNLPELVFPSSDIAQSKRIGKLVGLGRLRKLLPRVYTSNFQDTDQEIVRRNLYAILGKIVPGAMMSHRAALDGGPTDGHLFLTYKTTRTIRLPGFTVHLLKGPPATEQDSKFLDGLFISSEPRAFLENLQPSRTRSSVSKALPQDVLEDRLNRICQIRGVSALNQLRDNARSIAATLGMQPEYQELSRIIGAILGTKPAGLSSRSARSRSSGEPYDPHRLTLFSSLFSELKQTELPSRVEKRVSVDEKQLMAFFEAYFSNFIEGTEFEISEAYDIIFNQRLPSQRPQDAHDILGTFKIVADSHEMQKTPESSDHLIELLKSRHYTMMAARPETLPGEFKQKPNKAGETHFVQPDLVQGTLIKAYEIYRAVEPGFPRAVFMMFAISEVHPFVDGNGRIARIMMNAELVRAGLSRIIVPTVFREDYLLALRALSRSEKPAPLIRTLDIAQHFSAQLAFSSYEEATEMLRARNAFKDPQAAKLIVG